jgi:predicted solute-binding protein
MFYGLARGNVPSNDFELEHVLSDIETLNPRRVRGPL